MATAQDTQRRVRHSSPRAAVVRRLVSLISVCTVLALIVVLAPGLAEQARAAFATNSSMRTSFTSSWGRIVFTYDMTAPGCTPATPVILPIAGVGTGDQTGSISWGDNSAAVPLTDNPSKVLAAGGTYKIVVSGTFTSAHGVLSSRNIQCLISVDEWTEGTGTVSASMMFANASNLRSVAKPPSTLRSTNLMFYNTKVFNQDISDWDMSNVTNTSSMFTAAAAFNRSLSTWDVSNVTDMNGMFSSTKAFNGSLAGWDTTNVKNMSFMFSGASAFKQPVNHFNTTNVTNMASMFDGATLFNQPLNLWNVSKVINMNRMFATSGMTQNISNWAVSPTVSHTTFTTKTATAWPLSQQPQW